MSLTTGLISYYEFENTSGSVIDSHGSNDGTNNGATRGVSGKINNAFDFDGSNDYVGLPISPDDILSNQNEITITGWIRIDNFSDYNAFFDVEDSNGSSYFLIGSGGDLLIKLDNSNALSSSGAFGSTGTWYHVAYVYDGSTLKAYIDGVEEISSSSNQNYATGNIEIGHRTSNGDRHFDGKIDEVGIWDRALSASEISSLHNNGDGLEFPFPTDYTATPAALNLSTTFQEETITIKLQNLQTTSDINLLSLNLSTTNPTGTIKIGKGTPGTKYLEHEYPYKEGLVAGTTRQTGDPILRE